VAFEVALPEPVLNVEEVLEPALTVEEVEETSELVVAVDELEVEVLTVDGVKDATVLVSTDVVLRLVGTVSL